MNFLACGLYMLAIISIISEIQFKIIKNKNFDKIVDSIENPGLLDSRAY